MKNLKAYLYFYWDVLISVAAVLQFTIFTIGVFVFALFVCIVLDIIKRFKWQTEIEYFEEKIVADYENAGSDLMEWVDGFKKIIK